MLVVVVDVIDADDESEVEELAVAVLVTVATEKALPPLIEAAMMVFVVAVTVRTPDGPVVRLIGIARTYIVPALARVEVMVVALVIFVVAVAAKEAPMLLAFSTTAGAMGTP